VTDTLVLNIFPARFSVAVAEVWVGLWRDAEHAAEVAATAPGVVTWRDPTDATRLYVWRADEPATPPDGFQAVTVAVDENPQLFQRLLDDAVATRMVSLGFTEKHGSFVNYAKGSLLATIPALSAVLHEPIGIYPRIILEGLFTRDAKNTLLHGLATDVLYTTRFDVSIAELLSAGLGESLTGEYVLLMSDAPEAKRHPELARRVIGSIAGVRGTVVTLNDCRDATLREVATTSIMPEPTRPLLERYLAARYASSFTSGQPRLREELRRLVKPEKRFTLTRAVRQRLCKDGPLRLLPNLTADLEEMLPVNTDAFPVRLLASPSYSFDAAGNKLDRRIDSGLQRFGPYDRERMRTRRLRILVIAPTSNQGDVTVALTKLQNGLRTPQNVFGGLRSMYRLGDVDIHTVYAPVSSVKPMAGYAEAVTTALKDGATPPDLAIVITHAQYRDLPDSENPYFQTKALLLSLAGVPTQALTVEKLRKPDYELQYILNNAALACYAKMGGTSHVLRPLAQGDDDATELVFGIGRALTRPSRMRSAEETIGFATVFRANGEYLYNDCTPYCDVALYERALEDTVRRAVERVAEFEQLQPGSTLRLIFHMHRRTGRRDTQPILNAIRKLPKFTIQYALLHVNEDHPMQVYKTLPRQGAKGMELVGGIPPRGVSVFLGPRERLVTFVGASQYRGQGTPMPLRVTLDRSSTFTDLEYVVQQMFSLSFMSARSLTPAIKPVTIAYAEQLARMTGHLRGVQQWTVEMIQQKLSRKLWFI
jgi:hypothetical protein